MVVMGLRYVLKWLGGSLTVDYEYIKKEEVRVRGWGLLGKIGNINIAFS
jgi:hypothetical protein